MSDNHQPQLVTPLPAATLGSRLRDTLTNSALIVLAGVLVFGVGLTVSFYEWAKPWRLDKDYHQLEVHYHQLEVRLRQNSSRSNTTPTVPRSLLPRLRLPIKVAVLGPLSGKDSDFGLSQLRGVVSGAIHATVEYFGRPAEDWQSLFSIRPVNIDFGESSTSRGDRLARAFEKAEADSDVVFGPVSSQDAIEVYVAHKTPIAVPTIVTTAATPRIRENAKYGQLLLQLSPNVDTYSKQYMRFIGQFLQPRPKRILLFARDDEYGRSSVIALTKYASMYSIAIDPIVYDYYSTRQGSRADYAKAIVQTTSKEQLFGVRQKPEDCFIMIADTGEMMRALSGGIRKLVPKVRMGTLSSPDDEQLSTGTFEGMYVIYSFAPVQFSLDTLSFYQYAHASQPYMDDLLDASLRPRKWPSLETVDAEVHDATVYWVRHFVANQLDDFKGDASKNLYVTNFSIHGNGPSLGNEGALYLFKVHNRRIVPVEVDVY
jgi:hypothetical protein